MWQTGAVLLSAALLTAAPVDWSRVAPDLDERPARFKRVEMPFDMGRFSAREKVLLNELIAASRDLEQIHWRQNSPADIEIYNRSGDRVPRRSAVTQAHPSALLARIIHERLRPSRGSFPPRNPPMPLRGRRTSSALLDDASRIAVVGLPCLGEKSLAGTRYISTLCALFRQRPFHLGHLLVFRPGVRE
jgi:hypothetical protein